MKTVKQGVTLRTRWISGLYMAGAALIFCSPLPCGSIDAVSSGTVTVDSNGNSALVVPTPRYSAGVEDVLRMVDAKIDPTVVQAYIKSASVPYDLRAGEIIALKDHGVPPDVITAMIQRGGELRAQLSHANQAAAPQPMQAPYPATATPYAPTYDYGAQPDYSAYPSYTYAYPAYASYGYPYGGGYYGYGYGWPYYGYSGFGYPWYCGYWGRGYPYYWGGRAGYWGGHGWGYYGAHNYLGYRGGWYAHPSQVGHIGVHSFGTVGHSVGFSGHSGSFGGMHTTSMGGRMGGFSGHAGGSGGGGRR
jgi:hypothetical protein